MQVAIASLEDTDVRDLLSLHQQRMYESSPPGTSFALDLDGLRDPAITILAARHSGRLVGVGALKSLLGDAGEIKSMRTVDSALRSGVGQSLLDAIVALARERHYRMLLLETGTGDAFAAANSFYERNGFERRGPFGDYTASDFNVFYAKRL